MQFFTFTTAAALLALASAAPAVIERSSANCPGMSELLPEHKCPSGFTGCVAYERASAVCNGARRFNNDCFAEQGLGDFRRCEANGAVTFIGCTTNPNICNPVTPTPPPVTSEPPKTPDVITPPPSAAWSCPWGTWYARPNECSSGFVGCTADSKNVCEGTKRYWGSCPTGHGNYYNCANGFVGCTTNARICG